MSTRDRPRRDRRLPNPAQLGKAAVAAGVALALAACQEQASLDEARAYHPIPPATLDLMAKQGATEASPMLIRTFKKEAEFEVWKMGADGRYAYIKTFPMCRWSGQLGPKTRDGDRQVPEGYYPIAPGQMNPNSHYYLSFNVGYPNAYDKAHGDTGGDIMVHGICSSAGCFSMTDQQIDEIYAIAREAFAAGQREIQMESYPFHMTTENLAKYRFDKNMPFWKEIKVGSDYFETTRREPAVGVCNRHYVFGKVPAVAGTRLDPDAPCPAMVDADPATAATVAAKEKQGDQQVAALVSNGDPAVRLVYEDGGQNPDFADKVPDVSRPTALADGPREIAMIAPGRDAPPPKPAIALQKTPAILLAANAAHGSRRAMGNPLLSPTLQSASSQGLPAQGSLRPGLPRQSLSRQDVAGTLGGARPIMTAAASPAAPGSSSKPTASLAGGARPGKFLYVAGVTGSLGSRAKKPADARQPMQTAALALSSSPPVSSPETPFYKKWISAVGDKLPPLKPFSQASSAN
jgi:murein L,D-transpeptidase YafK